MAESWKCLRKIQEKSRLYTNGSQRWSTYYASDSSANMKKRYVKRLLRKAVLLAVTIILITFLASAIVERRMRKNSKTNKVATDFNGDPVTPPFSNIYSVFVPAKRPRPPQRQRHFEDKPIFFNEGHNLVWFKGSDFELSIPEGERKDWNDYKAMEEDKQRVGFGEHGQPAYINDESLKELERNMSLQNGFNALLSDMISVNRSVPDVRNEGCRKKKYFTQLPTISVIIPCYNEHFSILLRTLYSIVNRTPKELLEEIIIVDDYSDRESLRQKLADYIEENFKKLVKIVRLPSRQGLIAARLAGAKIAKGDVFVFFDSHIECNYNWLPPLLEPIAINPKISTCPIVDTIDHSTFAYSGGYQEGSRGAFNWDMLYKQIPLLPEDAVDKTQPTRNPIMMGGLFAIGRKFFWEIGGYDEGLEIWGAEQYEISFKIWMCGGMLLDAPCSRVAHIFRGPRGPNKSPREYNYLAKNQMRVAEVWMDEYKQYVYAGEPEMYAKLNPGDLSKQRALREKLKCKSFKWFLEVVAPDMLKRFPPVQPPDYASGALQSVAYPQFCLDTMNGGPNSPVGMFNCAENRTNPQRNQFWTLSWHRDLRIYRKNDCLDVQDSHGNATVWIWPCHEQGGNQFWYYDRDHLWLVQGKNRENCMEVIRKGENMTVVTNKCERENQRMKWLFGFVNDTALNDFYKDL